MRSLKAAITVGAMLFWLPFPFQRPLLAAGDISTARSLYAAASYEEALAQLASIEATEDAETVEQYRALCFLALDRASEAERSLERIVLSKPLYVMETAEVSPKLVTMFHDVRKRTLPIVAKELYTQGKADYDNKRFAGAADQFQQLLMIVKDPDAVDGPSSLAELRQLAEGFLTLTNAELAASAAARPAAPVEPAAAPPPEAPRETPPVIYTVADADVTPPVEVDRVLPPWSPSSALAQSRITLRGTLDIVIDDRGTVESASLAEPITPLYDNILLAAAERWTFRPAMRQGKPVKYRQSLEIVLRPTGQ
jgi:hypothetical protein